MSGIWKRALSVLMAFTMLICMVPIYVFANTSNNLLIGGPEDDPKPVTVTVEPAVITMLSTDEAKQITAAVDGVVSPEVAWSIVSGDDVIALEGSGLNATVKPKTDAAFGEAIVRVSYQPEGETAAMYADCTVTVTVKAESVTVTPEEVSMYTASLGAELSAEVLPAGAPQEVTWSSSDPNVAAVDENGFVTPNGVGTATITATAQGSSTAAGSCTVTVKEAKYRVVYNSNYPADAMKFAYQNGSKNKTTESIPLVAAVDTNAVYEVAGGQTHTIINGLGCANYRFIGWSRTPGATQADADCAPGSVITVNDNQTFYAVWEKGPETEVKKIYIDYYYKTSKKNSQAASAYLIGTDAEGNALYSFQLGNSADGLGSAAGNDKTVRGWTVNGVNYDFNAICISTINEKDRVSAYAWQDNNLVGDEAYAQFFVHKYRLNPGEGIADTSSVNYYSVGTGKVNIALENLPNKRVGGNPTDDVSAWLVEVPDPAQVASAMQIALSDTENIRWFKIVKAVDGYHVDGIIYSINKNWTVKFVDPLAENKVVQSVTVEDKGSLTTFPSGPNHEDEEFECWLDEASKPITSIGVVTQDRTLYAKYKDKVMLNGSIDHGSVTNASQRVISGQKTNAMVFTADPNYTIISVRVNDVAQKIGDGLTTYTYPAKKLSADTTVIVKTKGADAEIRFDPNGGRGEPNPVKGAFGSDVTDNFPSTQPTRTGYSFAGWYTAADGGNRVTDYPARFMELLTVYYAHWAPAPSAYRVEHYLQNANGFTLKDTEDLSGITDTTVNAEAKTYEGFQFDASVAGTVQSGKVAADGSLTLKLYYVKDESQTQPTSYTVKHVTVLDGAETVQNTETFTGTAWINDPEPQIGIQPNSVTPKSYAGYKYSAITPNVKAGDQVASGSEIKLIYIKDENAKHTVSYKIQYCIPAEDRVEDGPTGADSQWIYDFATVTVAEINRTDFFGKGYVFASTDPQNVPAEYTILPGAEDKNAVIQVNYAKDENQKHSLSYSVEYYLENEAGMDELKDTVSSGAPLWKWIGEAAELDVIANTTDKFGAAYSVKSTDPNPIPAKVELAAGEDGKSPVFKVYYAKKDVGYTVNYLLQGTTEKLADSITGTGKYGAEATGKLKLIDGCTPVEPDVKTRTITLGETADNVINFYYQLNLKVTADNASKRYGTDDPEALTAKVEGLREADAAKLTYSVSRAAGEDVSANGYAITPTVTAVPDYYKVTVVPGTFTITPRPVVVKAKSAAWDYDGQSHSYEVTAEDTGFDVLAVKDDPDSGLVGSDSIVSATLTGSVKAPGSKANNVPSAAVFGSGAKSANYTVSYEPGELEIKGSGVQFSLRAVPQSGSFEYDGTEHKVEGYTLEPVTKSGLTIDGNTITVGSDVYTLSGISSAKAMTHVGKANTIISGSAVILDSTGAPAPDGLFALDTTAQGTIEVYKRKVTLQSASDAKQYDGTALRNGTITVGGRGFAPGEGAAYTVSGSQTQVGSSTNWFNYTLNSNTNAGDYEITTAYGTLTVTPVPVYTLIIHYVDENNQAVAPDFVGQFAAGDPYYAVSPAVDGYTPDYAFIQSGPEGMPQTNLELFVVYHPQTRIPEPPEEPGDEPGGEIVPGENGYELIPIVEEEVPLAGGDHVDDILHFLLIMAALVVEWVYTDKRKKHQEKIFELKKQLGDTSMDDEIK